MAQRKFKKSPMYEGKHLVIHVGRGDKTIKDGEVLTGDKYAPFVALGYLSEIKEEDEPKAEAAPAPAPAPKPEPKVEPEPTPEPEEEPPIIAAPPKANESGMTKSPAANVAKAQKSTTKKKKGKRK